MQLVPGAHQPFAQIGWQGLGIAPSVRPFLALANQVGIDVSLVCQVIRYRAVDLFKSKQVEILADGCSGFGTPNAFTIESREMRVAAT